MKNILWVVLALSLLLVGCGQLQGDMLVFRTADPDLSIGITLQQPPAPDVAPEVLPAEEVGVTVPEAEQEEECLLIKGNIGSNGEKIYHMPDGAYYDRVKIDGSKGEVFFCLEQDAIDSGFRKASR